MRLRTVTERVDHYGKYTLAPRLHKYGISGQRLPVARPHVSAQTQFYFPRDPTHLLAVTMAPNPGWDSITSESMIRAVPGKPKPSVPPVE